MHPKVETLVQAAQGEEERDVKVWMEALRQRMLKLLERAKRKWPELEELLETGALTYQAMEGLLQGEELAPIWLVEDGEEVRLRAATWDAYAGEWDFPPHRATDDLKKALWMAHLAWKKREGGKGEEVICPLLDAACLRGRCAFWNGAWTACSVVLLAERMRRI